MSETASPAQVADLRAELARAGKRQRWLAAQAGVSTATVSRQLSGKRRTPVADLERYHKIIATAFFLGDDHTHDREG